MSLAFRRIFREWWEWFPHLCPMLLLVIFGLRTDRWHIMQLLTLSCTLPPTSVSAALWRPSCSAGVARMGLSALCLGELRVYV